jgi:hypothetical protein
VVDLFLDWRIILERSLYVSEDWSEFSEDRKKYQAVGSEIKNMWFQHGV